MTELINQIRFYHFISGVLNHQQSDPLCTKCKAYANTANKMKENISELKNVRVEEIRTLTDGILHMLQEAQERTERIKVPDDAVGQKKAGNCRMPEGVCFVKLSKAILDKI